MPVDAPVTTALGLGAVMINSLFWDQAKPFQTHVQ
jgi:hypothetical protein